jgi:cellulose 1,4-beta-cellobiosidase
MKYRIGAVLILALYGTACAPTNANKRRYRMDQDQLDPDSRNPGTPASTPGSVTPGTGPGTTPGGSTGGTVKPVPAYTQGNKANIFEGAEFYIDSGFVKNLTLSAAALPQYASRIEAMKSWGGTGVWLDGREAITTRLKPVMEEARKQAKTSGKSVVVPLVIYDLPNRDCYALASNGELLLANNGLNIYKTEYIDPIVKIIQQYPDVRVAAIIEPDSLPNAITNRGKKQTSDGEGCSDTVLQGYEDGIAYAIQKLALPHTALYLDAAHSGWLGYTREARLAMITKFKDVATKAGGLNLIRGLAINVANYTPLDAHEALPLPAGAPFKKYFEDNMIKSENPYATELSQLMKEAGFPYAQIIIDTGRNGEPQSRSVWGNWCNIARARIGEKPKALPRPDVDAYVWVKPPGESDGSSENAPANAPLADRNKRADPTCAYNAVSNIDPLDGAPVAGKWFLKHFENLVRQPGDRVNLGRAAP